MKLISTALTPELCCTNIHTSLLFYLEVLGFSIVYQREEDGFAMIERQGARIMLDQIDKDSDTSANNRSWLLGSKQPPFGNGMNLEIMTNKIDQLYETVMQSSASIYLPIENKQYRAGDIMLGRRQFIVLDPDGYMLRFSEIFNRKSY